MTNTRFLPILLFMLLLGLFIVAFVGATWLGRQSTSTAATGIVAERMDYMEALEDHTDLIGAMVEEVASFDANTLQARASQLAAMSPQLVEFFPQGSRDELSNALSVVWADWPEFLHQQRRFEAASEALHQAAQQGERAPLREAYWNLMHTCRDCHRGFRRKY